MSFTISAEPKSYFLYILKLYQCNSRAEMSAALATFAEFREQQLRMHHSTLVSLPSFLPLDFHSLYWTRLKICESVNNPFWSIMNLNEFTRFESLQCLLWIFTVVFELSNQRLICNRLYTWIARKKQVILYFWKQRHFLTLNVEFRRMNPKWFIVLKEGT